MIMDKYNRGRGASLFYFSKYKNTGNVRTAEKHARTLPKTINWMEFFVFFCFFFNLNKKKNKK